MVLKIRFYMGWFKLQYQEELLSTNNAYDVSGVH